MFINKVMYFDNNKVEEWLAEYLLMDPMSEEANSLSNKIMIEVEKIVLAVIRIHKLYKNLPWDDCVSVGMESCFKALRRFDPDAKKKSGKNSDLFTYMSISSKMAIYYAGINRYKKAMKNVTMDLNEAEEYGYLPPIEEAVKPEYINIRKDYTFLFKDDPHLTVAFNLLCDTLDDGIVGGRNVMLALKANPSLFRQKNGKPVNNPGYVGKIINKVYRIIKAYNNEGIIPTYKKQTHNWNYKPMLPKQVKKIIDIRTNKIWDNMSMAVNNNTIDEFEYLHEIQ